MENGYEYGNWVLFGLAIYMAAMAGYRVVCVQACQKQQRLYCGRPSTGRFLLHRHPVCDLVWCRHLHGGCR